MFYYYWVEINLILKKKRKNVVKQKCHVDKYNYHDDNIDIFTGKDIIDTLTAPGEDVMFSLIYASNILWI